VAEDRYAELNHAAGSTRSDWLEFSSAGVVPGSPLQDAVALLDGERLTVRREEFEGVGGFAAGILGGAELDLCLRLRELGRPVEIRDEDPGDGAALRRLRRRHGVGRPRGLREWLGFLFGDDRAPAGRALPAPTGGRSLVVFTDAYPARSETFIYREVEALRRLGWSVRVESSARPARIEPAASRAGPIDYLEDDPPVGSAVDLIRLALRHPLRCLADLRHRRRWGDEAWPLRALAPAARRLRAGGERHIHVHFAAGAALHAMRLARLEGIGYSVVGHGYDVFREPRNLPEKLRAARFVVAPCEYTAEHLRDLLTEPVPVQVIVMGVDGERFKPTGPRPNDGTVVGVGRLVEKKGFRFLIEAAAEADVGRLRIVGDGPLRAELEAHARELGLGERFELVDAWGDDAVPRVLAEADLLAMPSVIAADGDRDAMPVVVKEAMAMELPVVASDEVGLPELVRPEWGRLVAPGDAHALAAAITELLALSPERRADLGAAGRRHVLAHCDLNAETAKLAALIEAAAV
jgi:colanic acid/amylovoran biosynthesis glycosyltransferase